MTFGRSMTIIRERDDLVLFNTLRLDEKGLKQLEKLGNVKHVVRLAYFHGMDDPFYKERYGATVWAPNDASYFPEFQMKASPYFIADKTFENGNDLPLKSSNAIVLKSCKFPEAIAVVEKPEGKIFVTGDSLQNFAHGDPYANCISKLIMWAMGFHKPFSVGPAWLGIAKPDKQEMVTFLDHKFDHLLPAHGLPCVGTAYKKYEPAISALK